LEETEDVVDVLINEWLNRVVESKGGNIRENGSEFTSGKLPG
jgi:hypothetical protein